MDAMFSAIAYILMWHDAEMLLTPREEDEERPTPHAKRLCTFLNRKKSLACDEGWGKCGFERRQEWVYALRHAVFKCLRDEQIIDSATLLNIVHDRIQDREPKGPFEGSTKEAWLSFKDHGSKLNSDDPFWSATDKLRKHIGEAMVKGVQVNGFKHHVRGDTSVLEILNTLFRDRFDGIHIFAISHETTPTELRQQIIAMDHKIEGLSGKPIKKVGFVKWKPEEDRFNVCYVQNKPYAGIAKTIFDKDHILNKLAGPLLSRAVSVVSDPATPHADTDADQSEFDLDISALLDSRYKPDSLRVVRAGKESMDDAMEVLKREKHILQNFLNAAASRDSGNAQSAGSGSGRIPDWVTVVSMATITVAASVATSMAASVAGTLRT